MSFVLRPHQAHALNLLRASLASGHRRPMLQAVTGFGKTVLAAAIIESALAKNKRITLCVPAISLIDQTLEKLAQHDIHCVGVMQGQHPATDPNQPVQVASVQTLQRRRVPSADLVILDEAHLRFRFLSRWMHDPSWMGVPFIGLSATPWSRGLAQDFDDLIMAASMRELIAQGHLAPFRVFAPSHPDLSAVRTVAGDFREDDLAKVMNQPTLVADCVGTWLEKGEDRPTLLFAVDRAHARKLADAFEAAGIPTAYVDARTPRDERQRIGERLARGQIRVVCNVGCLTTGIDWDIRCIVLARPTRSEMLFVQIFGRGLRTAEGKQDLVVLDHSDTTLRLGFPTDIIHTALDDGHRKQAGERKAADKPAPLPKECPACSALKPPGIHQCPACGFVPERQSAITEREGSLIAIKASGKGSTQADRHAMQQVYSMLLFVQGERGYKSGFAAAKFKARFKVWPLRDLHQQAIEPDAAFLNWMRSQQIAFAKRRDKSRTGESKPGEGRHAA